MSQRERKSYPEGLTIHTAIEGTSHGGVNDIAAAAATVAVAGLDGDPPTGILSLHGANSH